jgi:transcriptional regulator with XRE-family HTH domain
VPTSEPPDPALAAAIRRLRDERGETQETVIHRSGLSVTAYVRAERGVSNPAWTTVRKIAAALDVTVAELARAAEDACGRPEAQNQSGAGEVGVDSSEGALKAQ